MLTAFHPLGRKPRPQLAAVFGALGALASLIVGIIFIFTFLLSLGGVRSMYVVSDSMVPTFARGDLVLVATKPGTVAPGDIVAYRAEWAHDDVVVHRVIARQGDTFTVKGDNNLHQDPPFTKDRVVGEVVGIYPKLGWIFNVKGVAAVAVLGALAFFLSEFFDAKPRRAQQRVEMRKRLQEFRERRKH